MIYRSTCMSCRFEWVVAEIETDSCPRCKSENFASETFEPTIIDGPITLQLLEESA